MKKSSAKKTTVRKPPSKKAAAKRAAPKQRSGSRPVERTPRPVSVDWSTLGKRLAGSLDALSKSQYLILDVPNAHRFVQFAHQGQWGIRAECVANSYLPPDKRLSKADEKALARLGWKAPKLEPVGTKAAGDDVDGSPNWYSDFARPIDYASLVDLAIRTLTEIYRVRHPSDLRYKAFGSDGPVILLPELLLEREQESIPEAPAVPRSLLDLIIDASTYGLDEGVELLGPRSFIVTVDGIDLTVVLESERSLARILHPLFPADADGDLPTTMNTINAEHITFGYVYVRDGEVRYAAEVIIDPFHGDVMPVALKAAAAVVRGLRNQDDALTRMWTV